MKFTRLKIFIMFAVMLFTITTCPCVFAETKSFRISSYIGAALDLEVADMHGTHGDLLGNYTDADVKDVELNQDIIFGIDGRYYFNQYIGIDADFSYSSIRMSDQTPYVEGMGAIIPQPRADGDLFSFSFGPICRYKGDGIWKNLNPYISPSVSFHYGSMNNVFFNPANTFDNYGKGGISSITGMGFGLKIGAEYFITELHENLGLLLEYQYNKNDLAIDHFRSFLYELAITTKTNALVVGVIWRF
jgi:hypothetical protein